MMEKQKLRAQQSVEIFILLVLALLYGLWQHVLVPVNIQEQALGKFATLKSPDLAVN